MIIHGGEPPHIEEPEPRFGKVIAKLNEVTYRVEDSVHNFNDSVKDKLLTFTQNMASFLTDVVKPIDDHVNAKGAQHGETNKTVGLGKKDNYRMATLAEQLALTPVSAYVSPQGAKQSILANSPAFDATLYQQNDAFQMASYYMPDEYPVGIPTVIQPVRYFGIGPQVPMLVNGDRLVLSPASDARYQKQSIFVSGPIATAGGSQYSEVQNLNTRYLGLNWNSQGCITAEGKAALFKPLADKKIYEFKSSLGIPGGNLNMLLFRGYASAVYKGLAVTITSSGSVITINHRFFRANLVDTDPTLVDQITSAYGAVFTQINKPQSNGPANGSHTYDLADFVNLAAGQTLTIGGNNAAITNALYWNVQDSDAYLTVVVPCTLRSGAAIRYMNLIFTESIKPGSLLSGGSASFTQLGNMVKDTVNADLSIAAGAQWLSISDRWDFFNPALFPGAVLPSGEVVKAAATKNGVRVKRAPGTLLGIKAWATGVRPAFPVKDARREMYAPSRHTPLRAVPERLIPIAHDGISTRYLSYALNRETGRYDWADLFWGTTSPLSVETTNRFGLRAPDVETQVDLYNMPRSVSTYVNKSGIGVAVRPLCFTNDNEYRGYASLSYADGVVTLGGVVNLALGSLIALRGASSKVRERAAIANPAVDEGLRETQIQVFAVTANRAIYIISDGINYAEAGVSGYTVTGNSFVLDFPPSLGIVTKPVTVGGQTVSGIYRESYSGDDVWMDGSDLLALQISADSWQVSITRPFGNLYGDLSFTIGSFTAAQPTFTPGRVNPARLYTGAYQFDTVDEIHPPLLIPAKGLYQYDPANTGFTTNLLEVGGVASVDPHDINQAGWVTIPAGAKVIIRGRGYILDREFPLQVNPTGTTYCYLSRQGNSLVGVGSSVIRETQNGEVMFGTAVNGVLRLDNSYIVLDNHVISATRRGSAIPVFDDDGANGPNQFFTRRDVAS